MNEDEPRRRRRWPARVLIGFVGLVVAGLVAAAVAFPSVAATGCPDCYGLQRLGDRVYVEEGLPAAERERIAAVVATARKRVEDFYGGRKREARVLVCTTAECYDHIGGGKERGVAVLDRALMLSPRGIDPVIAAHELSHVELNARLGRGTDGVPQWFDEGLAVAVSEDPRWLSPRGSADGRDRCRVSTTEALPASLPDWLRAASKDETLYGKAGCRAQRWLDANDGRAGVLRLIDRLRDGRRFADAYRQP